MQEFKILIGSNELYFEYHLRSFEMYLEGSSEEKVEESIIIEHAREQGYELDDLEIEYDRLQKFWRISADLKKYNYE